LAGVLILGFVAGTPAAAQLPLSPTGASGRTVTPVFEGWYRNPDGSFSISFGYYNRNAEEAVEIPIGPDNTISPGAPYQGQPARFEARRHWGVFAVKVPADFGDRKVVWTLKNRGEVFAIPGSLHPDWQIDALDGEAGSGNTPPTLRFAPDGPAAQGPAGYTAGPLQARVGQPLALDLWATDDGRQSGSVATDGRANVPVTLTWFKHLGPGAVTLTPVSPPVNQAEHKATATATFSAPGEYILRVRANDASGVAGAGHAQCCWTNAFVKVVVSP
jgi:hypothetical protein